MSRDDDAFASAADVANDDDEFLSHSFTTKYNSITENLLIHLTARKTFNWFRLLTNLSQEKCTHEIGIKFELEANYFDC